MKQAININFAQGLDTKTDPYQVQAGKFLELNNSIFLNGGRLTKRNGFSALTPLPSTSASFLTTFQGALTAIDSKLYALSSSANEWVNQGTIEPVGLSVTTLIRNNTNQSWADSAISPNGLVCTVYTDQNPSSLSTPIYKYVIADSSTGQNVVQPTTITNANVTYGTPRVFVLGSYFIIVYTSEVVSTYHLQYFTISWSNPSSVGNPTDISTSYIPATNVSFDAIVYSNYLYIAWNGASSSGLKMASLSETLILSAAINPDATHMAVFIAITVDPTTSIIYVSYQAGGSSIIYIVEINTNLTVLLSFVPLTGAVTIANLTMNATNGLCTVFYEIGNNYSYDSAIPSHYINYVTIKNDNPFTTYSVFINNTSDLVCQTNIPAASSGSTIVDSTTPSRITTGTTFDSNGSPLIILSTNTNSASASSPGDLLSMVRISIPTTLIRSVGLASKAFIMNGTIYFLVAYQSPYQPTYFLCSGSGQLIAKLAYENGGGYLTTGLPSVSIVGDNASVPYLYKDLIQAVNKGTNLAAGTQVNGIYSQTGINLAVFNMGSPTILSAEIGNNLNINGGFLWGYDGYAVTEQGFHLFPDSVEVAGSVTSGSMTAQQYFYQVTYEWTDNQGNAFRSAPSIPVTVTLTSDTSVTVNVPTLRLTYKTANPVKIVIYRWSTAQQSYYQVTSLSTPILNSTTTDSITYTDSASDATILGNNLLYTSGGVVEDIGGPSFSSVFLFDDRLWGITSEDPNLLWYSKQVIEATPVEMSDLFTIYVAPTIGAQGSTGPLKAAAAMDDKLCLFSATGIKYINGTGPDNTGANSAYSPVTFITSTVGCSNQNSIVFMPQGLMFEFASEAGNQIWLLGRDLATQYIGAAVQGLTKNATILSAVNIPGTNQVRFTLSTGVTLMYDFYFQQWGTFTGIPAISSTIYQGLHTYLNSNGFVSQESEGQYLDNSNPVLMSFTTGWFNLAGLQGYQRAYMFYLLGTYYTPFILACSIAYDYASGPQSFVTIAPTNFSPTYGGAESNGQITTYGNDSPYGGASNVINERVFLKKQRCISIQLSVQEVYNAAFGVAAGQGLSLSGINMVVDLKKGFHPRSASNSTAAS